MNIKLIKTRINTVIIILTSVLIIILPTIGYTAETLMDSPDFANSFFNDPLQVLCAWDFVIWILALACKMIDFN